MNSYLVPQIVYVGDRATLVVSFTGGDAGWESTIVLDPKFFPFSADIEFHRIVLEYRSSGSRLLVEFSAYAPGILEMPSIEIGGEIFTGIQIEVTSITGSGDIGMVLSGPAPSLAIPGTSLLVYGTMSAAILILLLMLWLKLRGRRLVEGWIAKWRRRQLVVSMFGIEKRLRRALSKDEDQRDILNTLSGEFRSFLSFFTGENCRAMTAHEFGHISTEVFIQRQAGAADDERYRELSGDFLMNFFHRCDSLRFNGSEIQRDDAFDLLGDLRLFIAALDKASKSKSHSEETAA